MTYLYDAKELGGLRAGSRAARACLLATLVFALAPAAIAADGEVEAIAGAEQTFDLQACVAEALEANASLLAERARYGELRGQMTQARATGLPTLDLSGNWSRGRDPSFALDDTFAGGDGGTSPLDSLFGDFSFIPAPQDIPAQTYWRTTLSSRWELRPGLVYNAVGAAGLGVERQEVVIAGAEHGVVEQVMSAYYEVLRASGELAALDADLGAKRKFLDKTRKRFELGLATPLDTLRAAVAHANVVPLRRSAAQGLRDTGSGLNVTMGRDALAPLRIDSRLAVETGEIDAETASLAVKRRPDLRQIELLEQILRKNRGAQKAEHRPYLAADASYGYVGKEAGEMFDEGHEFWNASLTLTVPLFDGMLTRGRVKETEASIRRTEHQYRDAYRSARLEVLRLVGDLEAARENLRASSLNLNAAGDALEQITMRYDLGTSDYLSVLDAQSARLQARSNYIQALNAVLQNTSALKRALGFSPLRPLSEIAAVLAGAADPSGEAPDARR